MRKDYHGISNTKRRQEILNYISKYPGCNIEDVVRRLDKDGIASRMVTRKLLNELRQENIVKGDLEKDNSRSYKLCVDPQNLLVTVPKNLEELFFMCESFIDKVGKISHSKAEIRSRLAKSIFEETMDKNAERNNEGNALTSIPFIMLDVINDVSTFSFLFLLPQKIVTISSFSKIYSNYFEKLAALYPTISSKLSDATFTWHNTKSKYFQYAAYLESKERSGFSKVGYLAYQCYRYDIAKEMYEVLDLLWIKNMEAVSLMYNSWYMDSLFMADQRDKDGRFDQHYATRLEYLEKHNEYLSHNNETLNKIHEAINLYIVLERFSPDLERWRVSDSGH
jgi:hypothetical protein